MRSKQEGEQPDLRVGLVESRVRKVDWLWQQIREHQREIRLLEIELARTDSYEYLDDDPRLDYTPQGRSPPRMGKRTGAKLGLLTPTQRRELLVKIETRKPRTSKDAQMEEIAKLLAQLDAMEIDKARERGEMIFIEIMVFVLGLMLGFAAGRVL